MPCLPTCTIEKKCKRCRSLIAKKKYADKNPQKIRETHLKCRYGLDWEDYKSLYESQNGLCGICSKELLLFRTKEVTNKNITVVDHNHTTNKVRGLLCNTCNKGLGHFKDNIELLKKSIQYLEEHNE